jgi:hypothetical protein
MYLLIISAIPVVSTKVEVATLGPTITMFFGVSVVCAWDQLAVANTKRRETNIKGTLEVNFISFTIPHPLKNEFIFYSVLSKLAKLFH